MLYANNQSFDFIEGFFISNPTGNFTITEKEITVRNFELI